VREGAGGALDPGDEYGLELALQLAEAGGGEVTVVSMGPPEAVAAVRRGLAMGTHHGVLVAYKSPQMGIKEKRQSKKTKRAASGK
jgi:electron transfer flavoprotein alpha/beta subunit